MDKKSFRNAILATFVSVMAVAGTVWAIDLGTVPEIPPAQQSSETSDSGSVSVTNLPLEYLNKKIKGEDVPVPHVRVLDLDSDIREVAREIALKTGETYESDPLDVREYREITFYVIPDQVLMGQDSPAMYQLDAYFNVTTGSEKIQKMGEYGKAENSGGWQEFGGMRSGDQEETLPGFVKLTTGKTSTRVLSTKIYGPYVHVFLTNYSQDIKKRFKIVAYLTR